MLDLNAVRADFAAFLVDHAGHRHSLDAALMHVVEQAYRRGLADAMESADMQGLDFPMAVAKAYVNGLIQGEKHEREACAALCEEIITYPAGHGGQWEGYGPVKAARSGQECAAVIRSRGQV